MPIVLATYPVAAGLPGGQDIFNLVFFAVLLSVSIQGSTLGWLATRLRLSRPSRPPPRYSLDLVTMAHSELDLVVVDLPDPKGCPGPRIRDLLLPPRAVITLITRGNEVVPATGNTRLIGWDQVTVLARPQDETAVREALLGRFAAPVEPLLAEVSEAPLTDPIDDGIEAKLRTLRDHVVLLGHGRVGSVLAAMLRARGKPFVVVEQDRVTAAALCRRGDLAVCGEGGAPTVLDRARIATAKLLLVTTADPITARMAVEYAQRINPAVESLCRVHFDEQRDLLHRFPRTHCVHGEQELAYALARLMLKAFGVSAIESEAAIIDARRAGRDSDPGRAGRTGIVELHVPASSPVVGRTLASLGLPRGALGVTIARAGEFVVPDGSTEIVAEDALLLLADAELASDVERTIAGLGSSA